MSVAAHVLELLRRGQIVLPGPPVLREGTTGAYVEALQDRLRELGHVEVGPSDAEFGPRTREAVVAFQDVHVGPGGKDLAEDGVVGAATWWALAHPRGLDQGQGEQNAPAGVTNKILRVALGELGVEEDPPGSNGGPRVDVYTGRWRVPWCAIWVSWCIREALGRGAFPPHRALASVAKIARWATDNARWVAGDPLPGDLFVILRAGADGVDAGRGHTGFVVEHRPGASPSIRTVEGNCANAVRSRVRLVGDGTIRGFVRVA